LDEEIPVGRENSSPNRIAQNKKLEEISSSFLTIINLVYNNI
jgi:hypothetical protein